MNCNNKECCCKCKYRVKIMKHPCNKLKEAKGNISETMGYGCEVFRFMNDGSNHNQIIFMETRHGLCEMFIAKELTYKS